MKKNSVQRGMIPMSMVFLAEVIAFFVILFAIKLFCNNECLLNMENVSDQLVELNNAIIIAFLIALITGKAFTDGKRSYTLIAKHTMQLVLINSVLMALAVFNRDIFIPMATVGFLGNIIKFWDVSKNILKVI